MSKRIKRIVIPDDDYSKGLEKVNAKIPSPLPKACFAMLLLASRGSGKTTLLINLLINFYKGIFHHVFIFSPTLNSDPKYRAIRIDDEQKFEEYTDEYLQSIIDFMDTEANKNKFALIVFDDCIDMFDRKSLVNTLITRARWHRISLLFSLQYSKYLSPTIRNNITSCIVVGNSIKQEELKKIDEILDPEFEKYYRQLKKRDVSKYNFIYMNFEASDGNDSIMFNFDNLIYLKDGNVRIPEI